MHILLAIRNYITMVREAVGVDLHLGEDGQTLVSGMHVRFVKGKLKIVATYTTMQELKSDMPRNVPLVVMVNGKGMLMRETTIDQSNPINQLFPGANPNDFCLFPLKLNETLQYSFICRKTWVDKITELLETEGLRPVLLVPGLKAIPTVLSFLEGRELHIVSPSYNIVIKRGEVTSIEYGVQSTDIADGLVDIGDITVRRSQVALLGAVLLALLKPVDRLDDAMTTAGISGNRQHYRYYRIFNFSVWSMLGTTLVFLIINFFVFSHFFEMNKTLTEQINYTRNTVQSGLIKQAASDSSYFFFTNAGWNKGTKHGYYIDRISALVPASVRLTALTTAYQEELAGMETNTYLADKIQLKGVSANPTELEIFSRAIKNISGVKLVTLTEYLYKRELSAAFFSIDIVIHL